jgi:hypothetical protein
MVVQRKKDANLKQTVRRHITESRIFRNLINLMLYNIII